MYVVVTPFPLYSRNAPRRELNLLLCYCEPVGQVLPPAVALAAEPAVAVSFPLVVAGAFPLVVADAFPLAVVVDAAFPLAAGAVDKQAVVADGWLGVDSWLEAGSLLEADGKASWAAELNRSSHSAM